MSQTVRCDYNGDIYISDLGGNTYIDYEHDRKVTEEAITAVYDHFLFSESYKNKGFAYIDGAEYQWEGSEQVLVGTRRLCFYDFNKYKLVPITEA